MNEEQMIAELKKGHAGALQSLMEKHQDFVYSLAYRFTGNRESAEEITQDVFVKVYRNIAGFEYRSRFSTWLYTITYRTSLNYLEGIKYTFSESGSGIGEDGSLTADSMPEDARHDWTSLEAKDLQGILWRAIDRLPVLNAVVILLFYMNQFSVAEISEIIDMPVNTVKTYLHRGRGMLKTILLKEYSPEELL